MADHTVLRVVSRHTGSCVVHENGDEADLTYWITTPERVIADRTYMSDRFRGTAAGLAMVTRLVADARAEKFKIMRLCPFANAQRLRHRDWADAFPVERDTTRGCGQIAGARWVPVRSV